jgi:hypothetical protein
MVVVDGGTGLGAALQAQWPTTRIQSCYFHIFQTVRRPPTTGTWPRNPRPAKSIDAHTRSRPGVAMDDRIHRLGIALGSAPAAPHLRPHTERPTGISEHQRWWYTHRDLRKTRGLYRALIRNQQLFTWIVPDLTNGQPLPRTTSTLEGGPNRALKDLFRAHRGLPVEHARRAAEWKLNSLTATPANPWALVRPEHRNPPRHRHVQHLNDEPLGPALGTEFSWEDGNGLQHGWASRSRR